MRLIIRYICDITLRTLQLHAELCCGILGKCGHVVPTCLFVCALQLTVGTQL